MESVPLSSDPECRVSVSAFGGSASGVLNNPVGNNRVFVHLEADWKVSDWWDGLRQGQSFVSNGPLRCWVEKKPGSHEASNHSSLLAR